MEKNNFDKALESIGQIIFEEGIDKSTDVENKLLSLLPESYIKISFPEVQYFMEEDWFYKECSLDTSENAEDSTYFIPLKRIL